MKRRKGDLGHDQIFHAKVVSGLNDLIIKWNCLEHFRQTEIFLLLHCYSFLRAADLQFDSSTGTV